MISNRSCSLSAEDGTRARSSAYMGEGQCMGLTKPSRPEATRVTSNSSTHQQLTALLNYLVIRGDKYGPLFVFKDGRFLTRDRLVREIRIVLEQSGLDASKYCSHSFRIGAATTAAAKGLEDYLIQTLGRWKSLAYLDYVKIPGHQLAFYSRVLSS